MSTSAVAVIKTPDDALDQLTGKNQPSGGRPYSTCVSITPYFLSGWGTSSFYSLTLDGVQMFGHNSNALQCSDVGQDGKCERGFVKITSTVQLACHVPIAL
jgi:hypothetical protein